MILIKLYLTNKQQNFIFYLILNEILHWIHSSFIQNAKMEKEAKVGSFQDMKAHEKHKKSNFLQYFWIVNVRVCVCHQPSKVISLLSEHSLSSMKHINWNANAMTPTIGLQFNYGPHCTINYGSLRS